MNRLRLVGLACLAGLVLFAGGLAAYFPGDAAARYLARRAELGLGMPVTLSPVGPTWTGLAADKLEVGTAGGPLVARNLRAPWSWRWLMGLPLQARIGSAGLVEATWSWNGSMTLAASGVQLQDLPMALPAEMRLLGQVRMTAQINPVRAGGLRGELPPGRIEVRIEGVEVRNARLAGAALPPLRLDWVDGHAAFGRTVQVEALTFQGDAQGNVSGTIVPNLGRPEDSRLNLNVTLVLQQSWMSQLGDLRTLAEGLLPGGRLDGVVEGTLAAPTLTRTAKRS